MVLSNNDGCVIARSNEAKAMGIKMAEPFFRVRPLTRQGLIAVSGDLSYYHYLSQQVMACMDQFSDKVERYSIDEAFFNLSIRSVEDPWSYCLSLVRHIGKSVGIPVSVGIASTKVLAKVANRKAKKSGRSVFAVHSGNRERVLADYPIGDLWGVGAKAEKKMRRRGINTALRLAQQDEFDLQRWFSCREARLSLELRGQRQWDLIDQPPPAKSLMVSRSLPEVERCPQKLLSILEGHVAEAALLLRKNRQRAGKMTIFLRTSWFVSYPKVVRQTVELDYATNFEPVLLRQAREMLQRMYNEPFDVKATGVVLSDLSSAEFRVLTFQDLDPNSRWSKQRRFEDMLNWVQVAEATETESLL